jgi:uncharacterized phage-associated protein
MIFHFNFRRSIQAVGVLLKQERGKRTNYMRLLKLLYIADRESLRETGVPITGDRIVAMDRGPVLSNVLNLIKGEHSDVEQWDRVIAREGFNVHLIDDPGNGALSRFQIRKLSEVAAVHVNHDEWDMVNITHEFAEWKRNKPRKGTCKDIPLEHILEAIERSADKEAILREAKNIREADRLFGRSTV